MGQRKLVANRLEQGVGTEEIAKEVAGRPQLIGAVMDELQVLLPFPEGQPIERSDIVLRADTDQNNTQLRTRLYGELIANGSP